MNLKNVGLCALLVVGALAARCSVRANSESAAPGTATASQGLLSAPAGKIPDALANRLLVGLYENEDSSWMHTSGVAWDARYRYLTKGWVNNWGYNPTDAGEWAFNYLQQCDDGGFLPVVVFYQMVGESPAGENESHWKAKIQDAGVMAGYFGDFKTLMEQVKLLDKPVLVLIEPDGFGTLQKVAKDYPTLPVEVQATNMTELGGLGNNFADFGQAFLAIRKAVGANNAILGIHVSDWADADIMYNTGVTEDLGAQVDSVYNFLAPFGAATTDGGETFDVLVTDPSDRDSDYYKQVLNQNRWWDAGDTAPVNSQSFNRYAEWLRLWNQRSQKRWVLWQIPLGNAQHINEANDGGPKAGYKDNRVEYFFGDGGAAHRDKFAASGVIALLFGAGQSDQSSYTNDYIDADNTELFMKSRAGAFLADGGLTLNRGDDFHLTAGLSVPDTVETLGVAGITTTVTAKGTALTDGVVEVEVVDAAGTTVWSASHTAQSFATDGSHSYTDNWTAPTLTGEYTLHVHVFGSGGTPSYSVDFPHATIRVVPSSFLYDFESGAQAWKDGAAMITGESSSTDQAYAGSHSLKVSINATGSGKAEVYVDDSNVPVPTIVTFHVWVPTGSNLKFIQPYVEDTAYNWFTDYRDVTDMQAGAWNTFTVTVTTAYKKPIHKIGVQIKTAGAWSGDVYIDSVGW